MLEVDGVLDDAAVDSQVAERERVPRRSSQQSLPLPHCSRLQSITVVLLQLSIM